MCLFWFGVAYKLRLVSYGLKTVHKDASHSRLSISGASLCVFWNKTGMRKLKNITLLRNDSSLLSGLQCNAPESLVNFQSELGMEHWRPERRPPLFHGRIVLLSFLIPALFLYLFQVHAYLKCSLHKLFKYLFLLFLRDSKPTFKYNSFHLDVTLQTNAFIATNEIHVHVVFATHLQIQYRTADEDVFAMNVLCAGDEHFWRWRWKRFTLEVNTLMLEMNVLKMRDRTSATHIHTRTPTQLHVHVATSDFQTELMLRWLLVTATHLQKRVLSCHGDPKSSYSMCTTVSSVVLNWFQGLVDRKNCSQTAAYSQLAAMLANLLHPVTHVFSSLGVAWLYVSHSVSHWDVFPSSRCVPPYSSNAIYFSLGLYSSTSSTSRRDCTPTTIFRVMDLVSKGFRVYAELQNSRQIACTIHCNTCHHISGNFRK